MFTLVYFYMSGFIVTAGVTYGINLLLKDSKEDPERKTIIECIDVATWSWVGLVLEVRRVSKILKTKEPKSKLYTLVNDWFMSNKK